MKTKLFTDDAPDLCHLLFMALTKYRRNFVFSPRRLALLGWLANQFRAREGSPYFFTEKIAEVPLGLHLFANKAAAAFSERMRIFAEAAHKAGTSMKELQANFARVPRPSFPPLSGVPNCRCSIKGLKGEVIIDEGPPFDPPSDLADSTAFAIEASKKAREKTSK